MSLSREASISEIEKIESPITVKEVEARFGKDWKHCHGPCIGYPSKDYPGKEYWFWFLPIAHGVEPKDFQIVFVTLVMADDPDNFEIIWPIALKKKEKQEVFKDYNKRLEEEAAKYKNLEEKREKK